jgi:hypothetical protein
MRDTTQTKNIDRLKKKSTTVSQQLKQRSNHTTKNLSMASFITLIKSENNNENNKLMDK